MTQEELQLENEKLNARLAKAASIFKEQKATITTLEDENKQLKDTYTAKVNDIAELEQKLSDAESDVSIYQAKAVELQGKLDLANTSYTELEADYAAITDENVRLKEELATLQSDAAASLIKIEELQTCADSATIAATRYKEAATKISEASSAFAAKYQEYAATLDENFNIFQ